MQLCEWTSYLVGPYIDVSHLDSLAMTAICGIDSVAIDGMAQVSIILWFVGGFNDVIRF